MKFSENWLRELVPVVASRDELVERLTMAGLEVEGVELLGVDLEGVIVAEIIACVPHPNADKLKVCVVALGNSATLQIVCGAPNARVGLKAPLATLGAVLPGGIQIKRAALRGVESAGMLCSAKELQLDADAAGLMELPAEAEVGMPLAQYLKLPDASIEIKLTPNRPDCLSLDGLARDTAALFGIAGQFTQVGTSPATIAAERAVRLDAGADCPRYCGRLIEGIDAVARVPLWMAERLRRSGLRSISVLVDVTNYVLLELGQPLHAFDAELLQGVVGVRRARSGETLQLLDESTIVLTPEFLVVADAADDKNFADASRAVALAGIMGGFATRVTQRTRNVFLESAHFAPSAIAGRARKLSLHTDASHRFERGVDPQLPRRAMERATELILQCAGGNAGPITEITLPNFLHAPAPVALRRARLRRVLGIDVADHEVARILTALDMQVQVTPDGWRATPPTRRFDIAIEEDLIEEIARVHGYEAIPTTMPAGEIRVKAPTETRVDDAALRRQLVARDYREAITYAFVDVARLETWQLSAGSVALANPLAADFATMRTSLLPGLIAALAANRRRQSERVRLFETGNVFFNSVAVADAVSPPRSASGAPREVARVAGVVCGNARAVQWASAKRDVDFYDLKGDVESLFAMTGAGATFSIVPLPTETKSVATQNGESVTAAFLHPGRAAAVLRNGQVIGTLGALHPGLLIALDLDMDVYVFELDTGPLCARDVPHAATIGKHPSVRRDLSFELPTNVNYANVQACVRGALGPILREVFIFDQYLGANLGSGLKSFAIGLILQEDSRTLTDADADTSVGLAIAALQRECQARLRG